MILFLAGIFYLFTLRVAVRLTNAIFGKGSVDTTERVVVSSVNEDPLNPYSAPTEMTLGVGGPDASMDLPTWYQTFSLAGWHFLGSLGFGILATLLSPEFYALGIHESVFVPVWMLVIVVLNRSVLVTTYVRALVVTIVHYAMFFGTALLVQVAVGN